MSEYGLVLLSLWLPMGLFLGFVTLGSGGWDNLTIVGKVVAAVLSGPLFMGMAILYLLISFICDGFLHLIILSKKSKIGKYLWKQNN